jgi:rubrerythrin
MSDISDKHPGPFTRKFSRKVEDFKCEVCGADIVGNGYTNHCPQCLHSKHVDINPGDRQSLCCGVMRPIARGLDRKGYYIVHECLHCGVLKKNKQAPEDSQAVWDALPWGELNPS